MIPVVLLIAGIGGAFLTDRALRPVRRIARAASRIEAEDLSHRLPVMGDDEFAHLAETINGMLSRLQIGFERQEQAFEQQKRFAADASHELRTPLTIIKANTSLALTERRTEAQYEKTLRAVDTAADRMTRIVQDLLLLARADADQLAYDLVPTSLTDVLALAVASLPRFEQCADPSQPAGTAAGVRPCRQPGAPVQQPSGKRRPPHAPGRSNHGDCRSCGQADCRFRRRYGRRGSRRSICRMSPSVFYRVEAARSRAHGGTGLGLSICRSIAEAHGGSLAVTSAIGQGTTVKVTLLRAEG